MPESPDHLTGRLLTEEARFAKLQARRRFTRAGLAAPIVLGSLVSKPVLGSSWYNCSVSGIMSGNVSSPGDAECWKAGKGRVDWLLTPDWPEGIKKGDLPNGACEFESGEALGTPFNGFGPRLPVRLADKFFFQAVDETVGDLVTTSCKWVTSSDGATAASLFQVLYSEPTEEFALGQATVVSLLNYYDDPSNYPVTAHTIIAMFNATCEGGDYYVNDSHPWTPQQVLAYLTSLYPPG